VSYQLINRTFQQNNCYSQFLKRRQKRIKCVPLHLTLNKLLLLFTCVCLTAQHRSLTHVFYILNLRKWRINRAAHDVVTGRQYEHVTISMPAMTFITRRTFLTNVLSIPGVKTHSTLNNKALCHTCNFTHIATQAT
jgi:hypothetical protein